jgi:hypothetical protein
MASFFDVQMRRFELLGAEARPEEKQPIAERPTQPSEAEKAELQEKRRRKKLLEAFSSVGSPGKRAERVTAKESTFSDEDVLLSGLEGGY